MVKQPMRVSVQRSVLMGARQTLSDDTPTTLQDKLSHLVQTNPASYTSASGELVVPAHALLSILRSLSTEYNITLLKPDEETNLAATLASIPDHELTPVQMIELFETLSVADPSSSATATSTGSSVPSSASSSSDDLALDIDESDAAEFFGERNGIVVENNRVTSPGSIFDIRERSSPLDVTPSAALKKRPRRLRGRSETNFASLPGADNNPTPKSASPTSSRRNSVASHYSHHRMLSNPTSPVISPSPATSSPSSPLFGFSRLPPVSGTPFSQYSRRSLSPDATATTSVFYDQSFHLNPIPSPDFTSGGKSPNKITHTSFASFASPTAEIFPAIDETRPSPHSSERGDNKEFEQSSELEYGQELEAEHSPGEDDSVMHSLNSLSVDNLLRRPSIGASSTHSAANEERIEALQKANASLAKKLSDSTRELEHRLGEHEAEVEELQLRIEDLKAELATARREENELKVKERASTSQLANLEVEMSKLQRQLEASRASYQAVQKQYQEQCTLSERYRNAVHQKDQELKCAEEANAGHRAEGAKWKQERDIAEATIEALRADLILAQQAQFNLDEQKAANTALKETIDRLRLDLDEIRNTSSPGSFGSSGGTMLLKDGTSKRALATLDVELSSSIRTAEDGEDAGAATAVVTHTEDEAGVHTGDPFAETIITARRRRKPIHPRRSLPAKFDISKRLTDATVQHDASEHTASIASQTSPLRLVSVGSQTSPRASPLRQFASPPTSPLFRDVFDSTLCDDDDDMSSVTLAGASPSPSRYIHSSSSSVQKFHRNTLSNHRDLPPSYSRLEAEEQQKFRQQYKERWDTDVSPTRMLVPLSLATTPSPPTPPPNTLQRLHTESQGNVNVDEMSFDEVSREAVEKWKRLKRELGFECQVIDRALARPVPISPPPSHPRGIGSTRLLVHEMEPRMRTLTPRLAREWADKVKATADAEEGEQASIDNQNDESNDSVAAPSSLVTRRRSPRWQFYNMYNSAFYPTTEKEDPPERHWNVTLTGVGVWALVFMTAAVLPAVLRPESGTTLYTDRQFWSQYNSVGQVSPFDGGVPKPGPANDALWALAENLLVGAVNVVRRAPPT